MKACCLCECWDTSSEFDCEGKKIETPNIGFCPKKEAMTNRSFECDQQSSPNAASVVKDDGRGR